MSRRSLLSIALALVVLAVVGAAAAQTPRRGGVLNAMLIENPPGFSIHESATVAGVWPGGPCFSNLVLFDPLQPLDSARTVIPELAEKCPYLDGLRYPIITERGTRLAALQTGRLDVSMPLGMTRTMADTLKHAVPSLVVTIVGQNGSDNVVVNQPPASTTPMATCSRITSTAPRELHRLLQRETMDRLIDQRSQELNRDRRLALVADIQRRLEADVARPMLGWRNEYFPHWPYVRNLVPTTRSTTMPACKGSGWTGRRHHPCRPRHA